MSKISYYDELDDEQIFIELVKRFQGIALGESNMTTEEIFGDGWELLDAEAKSQAERFLRKGIYNGYVKGIVHDKSTDGDYTYTRVKDNTMSAREIYYTIIKRFDNIAYGEKLYSIEEIYGKEWLTLYKSSKEKAERLFYDGIFDTLIKGIVAIGEDGDYVYKRIRNDKFRSR